MNHTKTWWILTRVLIVLILAAAFLVFKKSTLSRPWIRHTIDNSSRGADGLKLGDVNHDGLADLVTGWEEDGSVRLYLNPGPIAAKKNWNFVEVGKVGSPEDALFFDFNTDGAMDVVSACEGNTKSIFFHHAPENSAHYENAKDWKTFALPAAQGKTQWMFCDATQLDRRRGIDLIAGSKNQNGAIGWFESPQNPNDLESWRWHPICDAGWVMSLFARNMDGDLDLDLLVSDRKGASSGVFWLENPGPPLVDTNAWPKHWIGAKHQEVMFLNEADLDGDGLRDVIAAVRPHELIFFQRQNSKGLSWRAYPVELPKEAGEAKGVAVDDINLDGKQDLVFTCEHAHQRSGVMWMEYEYSAMNSHWKAHDISGQQGAKFDQPQLIDLDGDGDLDVVTTEESTNLGLIWYENPTK
jgi:FG-GAP-like repeat